VGHVDLSAVGYHLPDGRVLLDDVSFRVAEGAVVALVGPNGSGKTTLLRIIANDLTASSGSVSRSGGLGVMRQFIGSIRDGRTVRDLLFSLVPPRLRAAVAEMDALELALMDDDSEPVQLRYAQALADYADAGGYDAEVTFDACCTEALGASYDRVRWREVSTLSGGEQKRLALEALLRGPDEVLLLDEPDNYLDVPGKRWLEAQLAATQKSVLLVSHDRELLAQAATTVAVLELGAAGNSVWVHGAGFATLAAARAARFARFEELRRRWDEEHQKIVDLVQMYKVKAKYNDGLASRYKAAQTRLAKFEEAGPPEAVPLEQKLSMRLGGGRTGKRAVVVENLELTGLMKPFDAEIWFGDRVAVLGSNGSGKSHFLRLLARGGSDPDLEHQPVGGLGHRPRRPQRAGAARRPGAARLVRADPPPPRAARQDAARDPAPWRHGAERDGPPGDGTGGGLAQAGPVRARQGRRAALRLVVGRSAGAVPDPAARALRRHAAAAGRADRQPRPRVGRGAGAGDGGLRGHGRRGHARPLVRARLRPLPGLRQ
jgi:ATPase subunit of ABC transporter with duplicated ATPase domains